MHKWKDQADNLEKKLHWPQLALWAAVAFVIGVITKALFDYYG